MAPPSARSRGAPATEADLEAGPVLNLGDYSQDMCLNLSEARIVIDKTLKTREQNGIVYEETETLAKTRDYLEIFATFKDLSDAQQVEGIINSYGPQLEKFEKSQLGSLVPSCADEAKALIPSLERKVEEKTLSDDDLEEICKELGKLKRQAQL